MKDVVTDKVLIDGCYVECWIERYMSFDDRGHMSYSEVVLKRCD